MNTNNLKRFWQVVKNQYHLFVAILANIYYGFPSRKLKVIGVTGTDGKTTTTHLIYHILKSAGKKTSMISTVYAQIGEKQYDTGFHVTTPSAVMVQKLIFEAHRAGSEYFVLESTSHRLEQNQLWGINFEIGVLTNITHEHLDYHGTYDEYVKAKLKLLLNSKVAVVNEDDESYKILSQKLPARNASQSDVGGKVKNPSFAKASKGWQKYNSKLKILEKLPELTDFNRYNYAAAYTVCRELKINDSMILKAMKTFQLPEGRWELVYNKDFKIMIDFAHTPNALLRLLPEIRKKHLKGSGKLIHVFGAAGLRDSSKRYVMGKVSATYSDVIILTEEDYRTEDLYKICEQIGKGIKFVGKSYTIIEKRGDAIEKAIKMSRTGDVIVLTGKAHEKSLCRGTKEYPWNEKDEVNKLVKSLKLNNNNEKK